MNSPGIKILYLIQTFHTRLPYVLSSLVPHLPLEDTWVVLDKHGRGSWYTQFGCWQLAGLLSGYTHVCFLQDDVEPCLYFQEVLHNALAHQPDRPIGLWFSFAAATEDSERAADLMAKMQAGVHWALTYFFVSGQGKVIPQRFIQPFLKWATEQEVKNWPFVNRLIVELSKKPEFYHVRKENMDDTRVNLFFNTFHSPFYVTLPSLIEHCEVPSIIGSHDISQLTPFFPHAGHDLRNLDWSQK